MYEKMVAECMQKFKQLQSIAIDNDGKIIPPDLVLSKHKRISLKEYFFEQQAKTQENIFRSSETLENMIRDLKQLTTQKFEESTEQTDSRLTALSTDMESTIKLELVQLNENHVAQKSETDLLKKEFTKLQVDLEERAKEDLRQAKLRQEELDKTPKKPINLVQKLQSVTNANQAS